MNPLNLMSEKIVEGLQYRLEEQELIQRVLDICESEEIDIDDLDDDQINELFDWARKIGSGIKGAISGFKAGHAKKTSREESDEYMKKVAADKAERTRKGIGAYMASKDRPTKPASKKPASKKPASKKPASKKPASQKPKLKAVPR